jgi:enamine deaminase RidA (YjgF/YER057c/UK114 family)
MPVHRFINPSSIAKPGGYTHVVEAATPARIIYIAGQLGLDSANRVVGTPGDFRTQAEQVFINLKHALEAAGAGFEHVVKLNNYLIDVAHLPIFREVRDRYVDASAPPASTAVAISALARPGALLEVEAIAMVPQGASSAARAKRVPSRSAKPGQVSRQVSRQASGKISDKRRRKASGGSAARVRSGSRRST